MVVCVRKQRHASLQVLVDLVIQLSQCATLILHEQRVVGLCGVRQTEISGSGLGVVGTAEHGREDELSVSACYESLAQLCLKLALVSLLLDEADGLVAGTNSAVVAIPDVLYRLVVGLCDVLPSVSLVLEAVHCCPGSVVILVCVVRIHLQQIHWRHIRVSTYEQFAHIVGRRKLHTIVGQFVEIAVARCESHGGCHHRYCYI